MITNERQYKITKSEAGRFKAALRDFRELELVKQGIDPVIVAAQRSSLEQQLKDLDFKSLILKIAFRPRQAAVPGFNTRYRPIFN